MPIKHAHLLLPALLVVSFSIHAEPDRELNIKIDAPSLLKSILGNEATQPLYVYLPPSYHTSTKR
ncbi:hypothetical protein [Vibrio mexicanus]|uniref:hypothetical protein n=1 Tax=Vibrio mexicanus TaxID=1004326 RepID=UPI00069C8501|nr:hypothetical protein [Vibrio mexicanus]